MPAGHGLRFTSAQGVLREYQKDMIESRAVFEVMVRSKLLRHLMNGR
jgi:hypothetical protein